MPTVRIPVALEWSLASGSPGANIWHVRGDVTSGPGNDIQAMVDAIRDFYAECAGLFPNTMRARFYGEGSGVGDDAETFFPLTGWTVDGTGTNEYMPPATALCVTWRTSSGGRNGRGRTFLGPLATSFSEGNGTPDEPARAGVQTAVDNLVETSDSFANGAVGIYSRLENVLRDIVSGTVPNEFAVLRSRRD
jgi:hypothetical protein